MKASPSLLGVVSLFVECCFLVVGIGVFLWVGSIEGGILVDMVLRLGGGEEGGGGVLMGEGRIYRSTLFRAAVFGFQRGGYVRVDPEGPEGVVEVEDDEFGEREAVREGGGGGKGGGGGRRMRWLLLWVFLPWLR